MGDNSVAYYTLQRRIELEEVRQVKKRKSRKQLTPYQKSKKREAKLKRLMLKDENRLRETNRLRRQTYKKKARALGISLETYIKFYAPPKTPRYRALGIGGKGLS